MRRISFMAGIAGIVALTVLIGVVITPQSRATTVEEKTEKDQKKTLNVGDVPPDFTGVDLNGEEFTLSEMAGEKPVVIDFWATWCGPCRMELPLLNEFAKEYGEEVEVVGIGTWMPDATTDELNKFIRDNELVFRIIHNRESDIATNYYVEGIPTVVVVDTEGKVAAVYVGYSETVIEELETVLGLEDEATDDDEEGDDDNDQEDEEDDD